MVIQRVFVIYRAFAPPYSLEYDRVYPACYIVELKQHGLKF